MKKILLLLVSSISLLLLTQCNSATSSETASKKDCSSKACCSPLADLDDSQPLTYQGCPGGIGEGQHIVLIAADHEYRSEETIPALARILAKTYGFKCTVLFSVDEEGYLKAGHSNVPHMDKLNDADSLILFARFLDLPDDQMAPLIQYLKDGKPILSLRTSTHAFNNGGKGTYAHLDWKAKDTNFGRQIVGEGWAGHYGTNHKQSTRLDIIPEQANHPILTGVDSMWVECGGYMADPREPVTVLAMAQPINGMTPDSPNDSEKPPVPGLWTTSYTYEGGKEGQVVTSTYGASEDIQNDGYRRSLINSALYLSGLSDKIKADSNIDFIGVYQPTKFDMYKYVRGVKPLDHAGWETPIPVRHMTEAEFKAIEEERIALHRAKRKAQQEAKKAAEQAKAEALKLKEAATEKVEEVKNKAEDLIKIIK